MSTRFYQLVITLLTAFGFFMTWLHYSEIALIDSMLRCVANASGMTA